MARFICTAAILIALSSTILQAQDESESADRALNIGVGTSGLSFGNSVRHNGVRFNWSDRRIEEINGVNMTLWKPADNLSGTINGLSIGLVAPGAEDINGISVGGLAVIGKNSLNGVSIGGLALVSSGSVTGLNVGGLAIVGGRGVTGFNLGGLAVVSSGELVGINFGGLAVVGKSEMVGLNFGGLAVVSDGSMSGLNYGGLAVVAREGLSGVNFGGLAVVSEGIVSGINFGGLAVVGLGGIKGVSFGTLGIVSKSNITGLNITLGDLRNDKPEDDMSIKGISFAGYRIRAKEIAGFSVGLIMTRAEYTRGIIIGGYNRAEGSHSGVSIGIFNHATELFGIQIGLLNYAENNPKFFQMLPFLNFHF